MKTRFVSLAFVSLAIVLVSGLAVIAAEKPLEGTITSAAAGKLSVRADGEQYNFNVADDARITLDGKECKLSDLKAGQKVKVTWEKKGTDQIATKIEAKSQANERSVQLALADEKPLEGTITSAAAGKITVRSEGQQYNFTVRDNAQIFLDGKEAKLTDLKAGYSVKVTWEKKGTDQFATKIEAKSKANE